MSELLHTFNKCLPVNKISIFLYGIFSSKSLATIENVVKPRCLHASKIFLKY